MSALMSRISGEVMPWMSSGFEVAQPIARNRDHAPPLRVRSSGRRCRSRAGQQQPAPRAEAAWAARGGGGCWEWIRAASARGMTARRGGCAAGGRRAQSAVGLSAVGHPATPIRHVARVEKFLLRDASLRVRGAAGARQAAGAMADYYYDPPLALATHTEANGVMVNPDLPVRV